MKSIHAFVDEYGDANLKVEVAGVSSFFIITAVLVPDGLVAQVRASVDAIRSEFFGKAEMKSSAVAKNDERRLAILRRLAALEISTFSFAVDKRELDRESGLAHRKSFFKYLNRRLYERIYTMFDQAHVVADEYGREEFMKGFVAYVNRELKQLNLFARDVTFAKSNEEVVLQVADMVSGSLARVLDPGKRSEQADAILEVIKLRSVGVDVWPPRILPSADLSPEPVGEVSENDALIRRHCLRQATLFLQKHADVSPSEEDLRAQVEVIKLLLFQVQFADAKKYIPTGRIIERLRGEAGLKLSTRKLRTAIAGLRDARVVIGRSTKGYKLPISERDIAEFVAHANSIVPPMLIRVRHAQQDLNMASLGTIDALSSPKFQLLKRLVEVLGELSDADMNDAEKSSG
ncbi:MAG TPA: DUF3800 domain-containing protein [Polyangia bacterium]